MIAARPFASKMLEVLNSLATRADQEAHPLLARREEKNIRVNVITADRGLCGGFNTNILRFARERIDRLSETSDRLVIDCTGKKGRDYFKRRDFELGEFWTGLFKTVQYKDSEDIARGYIEAFGKGEIDAVYIVYNRFKSMIAQEVVMERLLPIPRLKTTEPEALLDYIYEPTEKDLFGSLLPKHVAFQIFHALLESGAAEHAARMTAMESATSNAAEMIDSLTLYANRVRQAAITKEIIEIVSGAQALG